MKALLESLQIKEQDAQALQLRIEEVVSSSKEMTILVQQIHEDETLLHELEEGSKFEDAQALYQQAIQRR
jgi:hypothetical protein